MCKSPVLFERYLRSGNVIDGLDFGYRAVVFEENGRLVKFMCESDKLIDVIRNVKKRFDLVLKLKDGTMMINKNFGLKTVMKEYFT